MRDSHLFHVAKPRHFEKKTRPITIRVSRNLPNGQWAPTNGSQSCEGHAPKGTRLQPRNPGIPGLIGSVWQLRRSSKHSSYDSPLIVDMSGMMIEQALAGNSGDTSYLPGTSRGKSLQHPEPRENRPGGYRLCLGHSRHACIS